MPARQHSTTAGRMSFTILNQQWQSTEGYMHLLKYLTWGQVLCYVRCGKIHWNWDLNISVEKKYETVLTAVSCRHCAPELSRGTAWYLGHSWTCRWSADVPPLSESVRRDGTSCDPIHKTRFISTIWCNKKLICDPSYTDLSQITTVLMRVPHMLCQIVWF